MKIIVSNEIELACPGFVGACVEAEVENTLYCEPLWEEIRQLCEEKQILPKDQLEEGLDVYRMTRPLDH